jgi:hypothetical protein
MQWWQAFHCLKPLESDRVDLMEARLLSAWCQGGKPNSLLMDWFSKENDTEWVIERDTATKERLKNKQEALNKKLAAEAAQNSDQ